MTGIALQQADLTDTDLFDTNLSGVHLTVRTSTIPSLWVQLLQTSEGFVSNLIGKLDIPYSPYSPYSHMYCRSL